MAQFQLTARSTGRVAAKIAPIQWLILAFSVAFVVFMIVPTFLSKQLTVYPLMKVEDAFALLSPIFLIPFYWLLLRQVAGDRIGPALILPFLVLAVLWVDGHGIHLAANSISHLLDGANPGPAWQLTYFYDEVLGHYLLHIGVMGLMVLLVIAEWRNPVTAGRAAEWPLFISALLYGFTFFLIIVEGQTAPLGVPFLALFLLFGAIWGRRQLGSRPLFLFFLASCLVAALLFAGWGLYWGGLPEFSEVGIIK